jgi:hypothetical protein
MFIPLISYSTFSRKSANIFNEEGSMFPRNVGTILPDKHSVTLWKCLVANMNLKSQETLAFQVKFMQIPVLFSLRTAEHENNEFYK